nr:hypothetical protein [Tanacetum cinerariifolium]
STEEEEEDGATEVLDPQDVSSFVLLEIINIAILGLLLKPSVLDFDLLDLVDRLTPVEVDTKLSTEEEEEDGATEVLDPQDVSSFVLLEIINIAILGLLLKPSVLAELQAKDITIEKLKENIKHLNKTSTTNNVKKDIDEIETIKIELEHRVTKIIAEMSI